MTSDAKAPGGFELRAAYVMGVAVPLLEIARRRTNFEPLASYADDLVMGALLLGAARLVSRRNPYGPALLVAAWGALCGGMWASFFGQLSSPEPQDISGLPSTVVVVVKGLVWLAGLVALALSVRRVAKSPL